MSSNENSYWAVSFGFFNHMGICTDELAPGDGYAYGHFITNEPDRTFEMDVYKRFHVTYSNGATGIRRVGHTLKYDVTEALLNYMMQTNDSIPDDVELIPSYFVNITQRFQTGSRTSLSTEEEALAFADRFGIPGILTLTEGRLLFSCYYQGETSGIPWNRTFELRYSGDDITLYTWEDWINFWKTLLGTDDNPFTFISHEYRNVDGDYIDVPEDEVDDYFPISGCTPGKWVEITNWSGGGTTEVLVSTDYRPSLPDPANVIVTTVVTDGDPPLDRLENGDGSITISDDGNINMSNDGGSFYLNEFGHSGMYANGDVSLTAGQTAQLGVGSHSISVVSDGFIFQQGGEMLKVSFDRIKEVLGE